MAEQQPSNIIPTVQQQHGNNMATACNCIATAQQQHSNSIQQRRPPHEILSSNLHAQGGVARIFIWQDHISQVSKTGEIDWLTRQGNDRTWARKNIFRINRRDVVEISWEYLVIWNVKWRPKSEVNLWSEMSDIWSRAWCQTQTVPNFALKGKITQHAVTLF